MLSSCHCRPGDCTLLCGVVAAVLNVTFTSIPGSMDARAARVDDRKHLSPLFHEGEGRVVKSPFRGSLL